MGSQHAWETLGPKAMTLSDTDILIDVGKSVPGAIELLKNIKANSTAAISIVTQMELIVGCRDKAELREVGKFLRQFQIIAIDEAIANQSVDLLQRYYLSHNLLIADSLIAATALILDAPFVSKNQRDYRFIQDLNLIPYP